MMQKKKMVLESNSPYDQVIFVTAGYEHQIRFWQAHSGVCHRTLQHQESQVNDLEISPDRKLLAVAGYQKIRIYDVVGNNPNSLINYDGVSKNVTVVGFQADGKWMFTGGEDGTIRIWDIRMRNMSCQRHYQTGTPVNTVCLHPGQTELYIGDQNGILHTWDLRSDKKTQLQHEPGSSIQCLSINSDGTSLAAVNSKGNCHVWRLTKGSTDENGSNLNFQASFQAHQKYALRCQFSPDATLLATTSADGTAKLWRTSGNTQLLELGNKSQRWVWDCAFSDDSQYLLTASSDTMARLWNATTGEVIREFAGHTKAVTCLAFRDCSVD